MLGGFDSPGGAVVGGLIIGVVSVLCAGYQDELSFLGRGVGTVAPYVVMLLVLLVRPSGPVRHAGADPCLGRCAPPSRWAS